MCLKIMIFVLLIKIINSYPANYVTNSDYDYNEDYYTEDLEKFKKSDTNFGVIKNMISSYIDNYFENNKAHRHHHHSSKFVDEEYQNDDSGTQPIHGTKLQKIGKLEPEKNNTIGDYYIPLLNTTLSKFLNSNNYTSSAQTIQQPWNENLSMKYKRQEIDKETRKNEIKKQILYLVGRTESLDTSTSSIPTNKINSDTLPDINNMFPKTTIPTKGFAINEKYQNFIPKCEIPRNTDEETWKDSTNMNLYFNINISTPKEGYSLYIAKATLSLFKISTENITQTDNSHSIKENSGDNSNLNLLEQEDRQIRVSVYWYTRSLKKHRVKRRLSDSKMVYVYDNKHFGEWIDFNIRPAAKSWLKTGRNLGLGVVIEDQEGTMLQANKYFKQMDCINNNQASQTTASVNTKPQQIYDITQILNGHQSKSNDIDKPHNNQHNRKHHEHRHVIGIPTSTDSQNPIFSYLPTLRICTVEIPTNLDKAKINEIKRSHCHYQFFDPLSINFESTTETLLQNDSPPLLESTTHRTRHHNHRPDPRDGTIQNQMIVITNQQLIKILEDMNSTSTETSISNR